MWETIDNIVKLILAPLLALYVDRRSKARHEEERRRASIQKEEINRRINRKDADTQDAVKALLRDRLVDRHREFMVQGYIDVYSRDSLSRMYVEYKNLGGNSLVDKLMEEMNELPTIEEEELRHLREENFK